MEDHGHCLVQNGPDLLMGLAPHSSLASMLSAHILNLIQVSKFLFHSDSATATSLKADDFRRQSWFNGAGPVDLEGRGDNYPSRFCSIGPKVEVKDLRPTATDTATMPEVWGHSYGRSSYLQFSCFSLQNGGWNASLLVFSLHRCHLSLD